MIKFFDKDGLKLKDEIEDKIQELVESGLDSIPVPAGRCRQIQAGIGR